MKLAVCLLTADRPEYTKETLASFARFNAGGEHVRLHADDGSRGGANQALANAYGFQTVYRSSHRLGQGAALLPMWELAVDMGCEAILHLENDWRWIGPIPTDVGAPCVRLYGAQKVEAGGPRSPTGTKDLATGRTVAWKPLGEGWEAGVIHWGGPPSITVAGPLLAAAKGCARIKDISNRLSLLTARPLANLVWHIGEEPTPDRRP